MIEKELFKAKFLFEPTAATIGINSDDWYCYKPGMTKAEVCDVMRIKKYDIVPILNKHFEVTGYFTLDVNKNANQNGHKFKSLRNLMLFTKKIR